MAHERYGQGTDDRSILSRGTDEGFVVLTNDRDFARLADENKHTGIVLYTDVDFLRISPREAVEAVVRIDRHYQRSELYDTVEWLDNWV